MDLCACVSEERRDGQVVGVKLINHLSWRCLLYESMNRKLKIKPIHECRCNERLQTKRFARLAHCQNIFFIFFNLNKRKGKNKTKIVTWVSRVRGRNIEEGTFGVRWRCVRWLRGRKDPCRVCWRPRSWQRRCTRSTLPATRCTRNSDPSFTSLTPGLSPTLSSLSDSLPFFAVLGNYGWSGEIKRYSAWFYPLSTPTFLAGHPTPIY